MCACAHARRLGSDEVFHVTIIDHLASWNYLKKGAHFFKSFLWRDEVRRTCSAVHGDARACRAWRRRACGAVRCRVGRWLTAAAAVAGRWLACDGGGDSGGGAVTASKPRLQAHGHAVQAPRQLHRRVTFPCRFHWPVAQKPLPLTRVASRRMLPCSCAEASLSLSRSSLRLRRRCLRCRPRSTPCASSSTATPSSHSTWSAQQLLHARLCLCLCVCLIFLRSSLSHVRLSSRLAQRTQRRNGMRASVWPCLVLLSRSFCAASVSVSAVSEPLSLSLSVYVSLGPCFCDSHS